MQDLHKLAEETQEALKGDSLGPGPGEDPSHKNVKWVYIGPIEPWHKRFKWSTLFTAVKALFNPEGLWRLVEAFVALQEVNLEVHQRPQDKFKSVTVYHKATRSRIVLRGDGNVDVHSNRHLRLDAVVLLEQCSEEADADPYRTLFGYQQPAVPEHEH